MCPHANEEDGRSACDCMQNTTNKIYLTAKTLTCGGCKAHKCLALASITCSEGQEPLRHEEDRALVAYLPAGSAPPGSGKSHFHFGWCVTSSTVPGLVPTPVPSLRFVESIEATLGFCFRRRDVAARCWLRLHPALTSSARKRHLSFTLSKEAEIVS